MSRAVGPALLAIALAGCAHSSVTLFENEGGAATGSVAVLSDKGGETVLDRPMTAGSLSASGAKVRDVKKVKPAYTALLGNLPKAPSRFTLYFDQGTTNLTAASRPLLGKVRQEVAARPGAAVEVVGHTDTVGSDDDNDRLSQRRAEEIVRVLAAEGFDPDSLSATGRGERDLLVKTADNVANGDNRRVEIVVR